jgi:RNA polymerase sigma factor (sigma-70 family)
MPSGRLSGLVDWLRRLSAAGAEADTADGQLVHRFVAHRDGTAFEALVRRHGPLVWGVCRRMLSQATDAEDAFQATFLVLARKAGSITKGASVRSWLYGTALRVAGRVRSQTGRHQAREQPLPDAVAAPTSAAEGRELRQVLDEEIGRLPAHERLPVILCYLEGKTQEETAQELGCPRGTVGARLSRALKRLRRRLAGRGVALSTAALAAALTPQEAPALPAPLIRSTVEAGIAAAGSAIPLRVLALAEGVIQTMNMSQRRIVTTVLLTAVLIGGGAATFAYGIRTEQPRPNQGEGKAAGQKGKPSVADLAKQRLQAAREVYNGLSIQALQGRGNLDAVANWSPHLLAAELDVAATRAEKLAALQDHVDRLKEFEKQVKAAMDAGRARPWDYASARCFRLEAELRLAKEKAK